MDGLSDIAPAADAAAPDRGTMIRRGYVDSCYGQLHYREGGPAGSAHAPLVLLHQNPSSSLEYEPLIREMARDRRVVAFDTPGYGQSDGPDRPPGLTHYAECFVAAARRLGIVGGAGCDVYGIHTGSLLAIEFALAGGENVRRIVVSGMPMRPPAERAERLAKARGAPALDEAGEVALDMARRLWDFIVGERVKTVPLALAARTWIDKLTPLDRAQWAYHGVWSYDYEARLPLVRQPLLLIQPAEEIAAGAIAAAGLVQDGRVVETPEFARNILDDPAAVARTAREMRAFLDNPLEGAARG